MKTFVRGLRVAHQHTLTAKGVYINLINPANLTFMAPGVSTYLTWDSGQQDLFAVDLVEDSNGSRIYYTDVDPLAVKAANELVVINVWQSAVVGVHNMTADTLLDTVTARWTGSKLIPYGVDGDAYGKVGISLDTDPTKEVGFPDDFVNLTVAALAAAGGVYSPIIPAAVLEFRTATTVGGVTKALSMFQKSTATFGWKVINPDGTPKNISGHSFQFLLHNTAGTSIVTNIVSPSSKLTTADSGLGTVDTAKVTLASSDVPNAGRWSYTFRDTTLDVVLGTGTFTILTAPKP